MARGRKKSTTSIQKGIKRANGTGSIYKLSGNRRKPWTVQLSSGTIKRDDGSYITKRVRLGYYATEEEAILALARYREGPYSIKDAYTFSEVYEMWCNWFSGDFKIDNKPTFKMVNDKLVFRKEVKRKDAEKLCKQYMTKLNKAKITGISLI